MKVIGETLLIQLKVISKFQILTNETLELLWFLFQQSFKKVHEHELKYCK